MDAAVVVRQLVKYHVAMLAVVVQEETYRRVIYVFIKQRNCKKSKGFS